MSAHGFLRRACARLALALLACASSGCAAWTWHPPRERPPLYDLEEPLELVAEPQDEDVRAALAPGAFSGIVVGDARRSLDALLEEPDGLLVVEVVENSPAALAGLEAGDLLLEARTGGEPLPLRWPSEWRAIELAAAPGSEVELVYDRAGVEREARFAFAQRAQPAPREASERFKEEVHAGVVVRGATEAEARAVGLAPGAGAVIVGLARTSPWRADGLRYLDLVCAVDGETVAHPQVLLDAIRTHAERGELELEIARDGARRTVSAHLTQRESEVKRVSIPLLYEYENERGLSSTSVLLGLVEYEHTDAAWKLRLLWFLAFGGGDADRLREVER